MKQRTLRVPASSANLGPGFDALAMAVSLYLDITFEVQYEPLCASLHVDVTDEHHLAVRTFRAEGGQGPVSVTANFAGGRGLGFSGAARVAGVFAARLQHGGEWGEARNDALAKATVLEGHADNVGASIFGGVVAVAPDCDTTQPGSATGIPPTPLVVSVPRAIEATVVMWIPRSETSTKQSRTLLPEDVSFRDAAFNVGRASLLVAALAAGDTRALRAGTADRLHQDRRFERVPETRRAYETLLEHNVYCAWLSGSGPSVAALCDPNLAHGLEPHMPNSGRTVVCKIDDQGTRYL